MKIRFGPFTLDLDTRQLTKGRREIHLAPKAFELLAALVLDRPKVLSKAVLLKRLWPERVVASPQGRRETVDESSLTSTCLR